MRLSAIKRLAFTSFLLLNALSFGNAENQVGVPAPNLVTTTSSPKTYFRGDINLDGKVSVIDVVILVAHLNGKTSIAYHKETADIDNNGIVNKEDVALLLRWILAGTHGDNITIPEDDDNTTGTTPSMPWG